MPFLEDTSSESVLGSDVFMDFRNEDETFPWTLSSDDLKTISSQGKNHTNGNTKIPTLELPSIMRIKI